MWSNIRMFFSKLISKQDPSDHHDANEVTGLVTIGIVVGHEKKAPGADIKKYDVSEYTYNSEIAKLIMADHAELCKGRMTFVTIFRDGIGIQGAYKKAMSLKCDAVIELHFNSANGKATGTETLCSYDSKDIEFAMYVQKHVCKAFDRVGQSRGIKKLSLGDRGSASCYAYSRPNCLVEPAFGDVDSDGDLMMNRKKEYAESLISACLEYFFH